MLGLWCITYLFRCTYLYHAFWSRRLSLSVISMSEPFYVASTEHDLFFWFDSGLVCTLKNATCHFSIDELTGATTSTIGSVIRGAPFKTDIRCAIATVSRRDASMRHRRGQVRVELSSEHRYMSRCLLSRFPGKCDLTATDDQHCGTSAMKDLDLLFILTSMIFSSIPLAP